MPPQSITHIDDPSIESQPTSIEGPIYGNPDYVANADKGTITQISVQLRTMHLVHMMKIPLSILS